MVVASLRYPGEFGGLAPLVSTRPGEEAGLTLESYRVFFSDWVYFEIFAKSFGVAVLTTLVCLLMAYPVAALIARSPKRYRDMMVLLVVLPFASNFLVRVYAWMIMLGPFELLFSRFAVICGMVYVHLPFMILPLYTNLEKHDPALLDAAQDLGANAWQRFCRVTFPLSLPGVFSGAPLVFIPVLGSFLASGGKLLLAGAAAALLALAGVLGLAGKRREMPGFWLWFVSLLAYAFLYIPLVIVVIFSFNDSKLNAEWVGFTTAWYLKLFSDEDMLRAALNSLSIACGAAAIATVRGTMAGLSMHRFKPKLLPFLVFTPVAMPEILLGVSLLIFFLNSVSPALGALGIDFGLGLTTVVIAHVTFCIGFVAIIVRARLAGMDESIFEAARDLGATPWQTFRLVTLPLIMPGVIAGALMAFTLSSHHFVITFFTPRVGTKTLPLEIYTMIKVAVTPEVNAVSALLMALTLGMIMIAAKLAPDLMQART